VSVYSNLSEYADLIKGVLRGGKERIFAGSGGRLHCIRKRKVETRLDGQPKAAVPTYSSPAFDSIALEPLT